MIDVSLCMIVRNETLVLERCLESVKHCVEEIIIVDTGSTDDTKGIAGRYTDHIVDFRWIEDFAAARNFAFSQATSAYILWLDADDVLEKDESRKFQDLKCAIDSMVDVVSMPYHLATDDHGHVITTIRRNRLVKRDRGFRWHGALHEDLAVSGQMLHSDIAVTHQPISRDRNRNLNMYERRLAAGEEFAPRDLFYYANELLDHHQLDRAMRQYLRFLEAGQGWLEDNIAACGKLADCYSECGQPQQARLYALRSFAYDLPRAEFCCRLGYGFMQEMNWQKAIFWYELATHLDKPHAGLGLVHEPCWTWLPHLQLCVCYDHLGDYHAAYEHNEMARRHLPDDARVLHNKVYLDNLLFSDAP